MKPKEWNSWKWVACHFHTFISPWVLNQSIDKTMHLNLYTFGTFTHRDFFFLLQIQAYNYYLIFQIFASDSVLDPKYYIFRNMYQLNSITKVVVNEWFKFHWLNCCLDQMKNFELLTYEFGCSENWYLADRSFHSRSSRH